MRMARHQETWKCISKKPFREDDLIVEQSAGIEIRLH